MQPQYFTDKENEQIAKAKFAFNVVMKFAENSQKSYHLQLKLIYALMPEMIALYDASALRLLNRKWVVLAINSKVVPSAEALYTVHAVSDENQIWLHTHGLHRCNIHEVEILDSNKEDYNTHYQVVSSYAGRLLSEYIKAFESPSKGEKTGNLEEDEIFNLGIFIDSEPIVATSIPWEECLSYYPKEILGGIADRENDHNYRTNLIFLYGSEEDLKKNRIKKVNAFTDELRDNSIFYISTAETERMSLLARERFSYVEKTFKERKAENKAVDVIIKLGLATLDDDGNIDEENREHIWFKLLSFNKDGFRAKLLQEAYNIPNIHEGEAGDYSVNDVSDWQIYMDTKTITPETVYLLDLEKDSRSNVGTIEDENMVQNKLIYNKENREEFFKKIGELTEQDKYTECINALENISAEERDYKICYTLARAYQNFAIIGDDDKGTEYKIGDEALLKSLEILESVREEGENKADWNMRMAYGYQYLKYQEEKAIPYALRWAELDPKDKNALEVVKECQ